jgi:molecular chaperone DnaJ
MKNYYVILGVPTDADLEEIRAAYRQLAKELHPDYYGRDSGPFIDLQEAYAVLSDPQRRQAYDKERQNISASQTRFGRPKAEPLFTSEPRPEPLIPEQPWTDLGDYSLGSSFRTIGPSFDELFDRLRRNFSLSKPKTERLRSINVEIRISPQEAMQGGRARILVPARLRCPDCRGSGGVGFFECWRCDGFGFIQGEYPVTISFPAGVVNNYVAEIPLDRLGITNFYLRAIFRVSDTA